MRSLARCLALLVLCASATGCFKVGPDFETPPSQVNADWVGARDAHFSSDAAQTLEWWKNFGDPVLESLVGQALRQNLPLQMAGLRVLEGRGMLGAAVGALYPQAQAVGGSAGRLALSENAEPVSNLPDFVRDGIDTSFNNYRLGFDAAWELDFWGRFRRTVESADAHLAATLANYDAVMVTLTGEVAAAYVLLRTLEERLAVAQSNVALQTRSLEISEVRSRNQLTTELDPQLARALLRGTEASVPGFEAAIRKARNALAVLVGRRPGELDALLAGGSGIPSGPAEVALGIPADLLRRRPDIRRAELHAASQSARIGVAKADLFPALSLVGSIGWAAESSGDLLESASKLGYGLVTIRWNILNYGRIRSLIRTEDARFQQLLVNYQNAVLQAAREVEDAAVSFLSAHERVALLEDGVTASKRAVELASVQYRDGLTDYTLVLDSQRFLRHQEDLLVQARGDVAGNLVAVYKALGGGWEQRSLDQLIPEETRETMRDRTYWGDLLEPGSIEPVPDEDRGGWRWPDF